MLTRESRVGRAAASANAPNTSLVAGAAAHKTLPAPQWPCRPVRPADQAVGFGGRQERYRVHRQQQLRCYDPVDGKYVTFSHERYLHAWLLHRFRADVRSLDPSPSPIAYLRKGHRFTSKPDLQWITPDGRAVCLWLKEEWPVEQRQRYEHFALTHGCEVTLMQWTDLEEARVLLDNLESARQVMTSVAFTGVDLMPIAEAIHSQMREHSEVTRGELGATLTCKTRLESDEHVDAALFHMHALGSIYIQLEEAEYGDDTIIRN